MVRTPGPPPSPSSSATPPDVMTSQLKFVLTSGVYQSPTTPQPGQFPDTGATTPWNTKAGTFGCNVDCDFAVSTASLVNGASPAAPTTVLTPSGSASGPAFSAKPMHCQSGDSVTSDLTITVWQLNPDGSKAAIQGGFGGTMILKQAPVALWNAYDKNNDPTQNAAPPDLTNPTNAATVQLCMGVALTPPKPGFLRSFIVDFDPTAAMILTFRSQALPNSTPKQNTLLASGVVDGNQSPPQRYTQVQSDWTSFSGTGQSLLGGTVTNGVQSPGLLQMAAQTLGWDKTSPSSVLAASASPPAASGGTATTPPTPSQPAWMLNGEVPDFLIQNIDTQYPVLPRYSASGIAV
jgi:hypothetical protein